MGIKDYSDYKQDRWYQSTTDEINGHVPQGASLHAVLDKGGNTLKELVSPATLNAAYLRNWQSYDSGVLADIWVRTAASKPQDVTYTGSPAITTEAGKKTYTFSGGGLMNVHSYNGSGNTVENQNYSGAFTVTYTVSSGPQNRYIGELFYYNSSQHRYVSMGNRTWWYGTAYTKSTLQVSGVDTGSGSAKLVFTPRGGGGGSVTITPYTPETVARKVLQPASINPATTRDRNWCYYTRVPGSAETKTKTFLVQGGIAALQNFAFDMMEEE